MNYTALRRQYFPKNTSDDLNMDALITQAGKGHIADFELTMMRSMSETLAVPFAPFSPRERSFGSGLSCQNIKMTGMITTSIDLWSPYHNCRR